MLTELVNSVLDFVISHVPVEIDEEEIFPRLALARPGLNFRHIDAITPKGGQRAVQRSDFICDTDHDAGPVVSGGWAALTDKYQEPGGVGWVILNIIFQDFQAVLLRRQNACDGPSELFFSRELGRARVG